MSMPDVIETERLRLRLLRQEDAPQIHELMTFPVAQYLTSVPWPNTLDDISGFLGTVAQTPGQYAVEEGGQFRGIVGGASMLGYWYSEAAWGRGIATEAARAYRDAWFGHTEAAQMRSGHAMANTASGHVLEKIGFQSDGYRVEMLNRTRARALLRLVCLSRERWQALTARGDGAKRQA